MKSRNTLLFALGLASSAAAFAQPVQPSVDPRAGKIPQAETVATPPAVPGRMPAPVMGSDSGAASSGSGGQLITPAIAQSRPSVESPSIRVEPRTENGVTYLCGGVGEEESLYMKQAATRDYDLMMTFAEKSGNYVADVAVTIKDARGKTVLDTTCDGPILLVDLPSGGYRIHAETGGRAIDRTALVKAGKGSARQMTFAWPAGTSTAVGMEKSDRTSGGQSSGASGEESERNSGKGMR